MKIPMKKVILLIFFIIQARIVISQISEDFYEGKFMNIYALYQPYFKNVGAQIFEFETSGPKAWEKKYFGVKFRALPDFLNSKSFTSNNFPNIKNYATSWFEWFLGTTVVGKDKFNIALAANLLNIWQLKGENYARGFVTTGFRGKLDIQITNFLLLSYTHSQEFSIRSTDNQNEKAHIVSNAVNLYTRKLLFIGFDYVTFRYGPLPDNSFNKGHRLELKLGVRLI